MLIIGRDSVGAPVISPVYFLETLMDVEIDGTIDGSDEFG